MSRLKIFVISVVAIVTVVSYLLNGCEARHIEADDLGVAASEWKKGEESDHHQSGYDKHGKKHEKGYDEKHGYPIKMF